MNYEYLANVPLDEAVDFYMKTLREGVPVRRVEVIDVAAACGRITAKAVYANISSPHYNSCAMDGIALLASVTFGATETTPVILQAGDFVPVDTGDPLPLDCDCVVMIEDVVEQGDEILLYAAATAWQHVRQIGEDICQGDMLLPSFMEITPAATGALVAGGIMQVEVLCKPVVGIIPTGDEIVPPCQSPGDGEIMEFNSIIFSGILESWSAAPKTYPIVKDRLPLITEALRTAAEDCDMVLINAGSSAGREDFSAAAIKQLGQVIYHGIAIKPGKPAILGIIHTSSGVDIPVIGVPGYPVSGIIVLETLVRPVIDELLARVSVEGEKVEAVLTRRLNSSLKYREFIRTKLGNVNGQLVAVPLNRGAGVVTSFVKADGIIDVPQNREGYEAGEKIQVRLLRPRKEIDSMLVITGSHDPLIDEAADLLRRKYTEAFTASAHVGSMGGIMAVKRGEAHMAGIHLLDETTGEYNRPFIKRYFPEGGVVRKPCVKRIQGFMVPRGNPKKIRDWADISEGKLSYVNRQKGSGTRILCDYFLKRTGIDSSGIYGYEREETTHTGVAAIVAAGSGDVGLGIYSAAKIFGLDFVPVCEEIYDLLIAEWALETEPVQRFLEVLSSDEFHKRLVEMGGYRI